MKLAACWRWSRGADTDLARRLNARLFDTEWHNSSTVCQWHVMATGVLRCHLIRPPNVVSVPEDGCFSLSPLCAGDHTATECVDTPRDPGSMKSSWPTRASVRSIWWGNMWLSNRLYHSVDLWAVMCRKTTVYWSLMIVWCYFASRNNELHETFLLSRAFKCNYNRADFFFSS